MKIEAQTGEQVVQLTIERENGHFRVTVDGRAHDVDAQKLEGEFYSILMEGRSYEVSVEVRGDAYVVRHGATERWVRLSDPSRRARAERAAASGPTIVPSVMPGRVVRLLVGVGDAVQPGQGLVVVEAMKMENEIAATRAGKIGRIEVTPGQAVERGAPLLTIE